MTQRIVTEMTLDQRQLLRELQKQNQAILRNNEQLMKLARTGRRAGRDIQTGMRGATGALTRFAAGFISIGSAISAAMVALRVFNEENASMRKRQSAAAMAAMTAAQAIRAAKNNFIADVTMDDRQLETRIEQVAKQRRATVSITAAVFAEASTARGASTNALTMEATSQALRLDPSNLELAATFASRSLDIMAIQAGKGQPANRETLKSILGFMKQVQVSSRIVTPAKAGDTSVPAIIAGVQAGDTVEQAAELFSTITLSMGDRMGRRASTAYIDLATRLAHFIPKRDKDSGKLTAKSERGEFEIPEEQWTEFEAAKNTPERVRVLQRNEEIRRAFLSQHTFPVKSQASIEGILSGAERESDYWKKMRSDIKPVNPKQVVVFEQEVARLEASRRQYLLTAQQEMNANIEQANLQSESGQEVALALSILNATFEGTEQHRGGVNLKGPDMVKRAWYRRQAGHDIESGIWRYAPLVGPETTEEGRVTAARPGAALERLIATLEIIRGDIADGPDAAQQRHFVTEQISTAEQAAFVRREQARQTGQIPAKPPQKPTLQEFDKSRATGEDREWTHSAVLPGATSDAYRKVARDRLFVKEFANWKYNEVKDAGRRRQIAAPTGIPAVRPAPPQPLEAKGKQQQPGTPAATVPPAAIETPPGQSVTLDRPAVTQQPPNRHTAAATLPPVPPRTTDDREQLLVTRESLRVLKKMDDTLNSINRDQTRDRQPQYVAYRPATRQQSRSRPAAQIAHP